VKRYALVYRVGFTPWERYGTAAVDSIRTLLDREVADRAGRPGRALDLGCGRGQYTTELTRRGWDVVGVDHVPRAIEAANRKHIPNARFVVADVTDLGSTDIGTFDFFFDVGCFQHLSASQRTVAGRSVSALADRNATLLMLEFGVTPFRHLVGGVSRSEVESAFPGWEMLSVEPAQTQVLGWPLTRTGPQWYRLRKLTIGAGHDHQPQT
jgi:SAM-dependent methyltransferase